MSFAATDAKCIAARSETEAIAQCNSDTYDVSGRCAIMTREATFSGVVRVQAPVGYAGDDYEYAVHGAKNSFSFSGDYSPPDESYTAIGLWDQTCASSPAKPLDVRLSTYGITSTVFESVKDESECRAVLQWHYGLATTAFSVVTSQTGEYPAGCFVEYRLCNVDESTGDVCRYGNDGNYDLRVAIAGGFNTHTDGDACGTVGGRACVCRSSAPRFVAPYYACTDNVFASPPTAVEERRLAASDPYGYTFGDWDSNYAQGLTEPVYRGLVPYGNFDANTLFPEPATTYCKAITDPCTCCRSVNLGNCGGVVSDTGSGCYNNRCLWRGSPFSEGCVPELQVWHMWAGNGMPGFFGADSCMVQDAT